MTNPTTDQRRQHGFWQRQSFDPDRPEDWARPYPINHRITTEVKEVEVSWSRIHFGLLDNASAAGVEVLRRPLGLFSGGGCCVWGRGGEGPPVTIVDGRLREHRDVVEVLAHELGHATHGVMFADDEPDHDRRQQVREVAAYTLTDAGRGAVAAARRAADALTDVWPRLSASTRVDIVDLLATDLGWDDAQELKQLLDTVAYAMTP